MKLVIAIDPGLKKCGIILANLDLKIVIEGKTILATDVISYLKYLLDKYSIDSIYMGNGTGSKYCQDILSNLMPIKMIEEKNSTFRARYRYWELWPPSKFISFIPRGLLKPKCDLDFIAALVLLEDHLKYKLTWPSN